MQEKRCWECGAVVEQILERPGRVLCPKCRPIQMARSRDREAVWLEVQCRHLLDVALDQLEDAGADVFAYRLAYDEVLVRQVRGPMRFEDVPSVKIELVLRRLGIEYLKLTPLQGRRVDFVLPRQRIILMVRRPTSSEEALRQLTWENGLIEGLGADWVILKVSGALAGKYQDAFRKLLGYLRRKALAERYHPVTNGIQV